MEDVNLKSGHVLGFGIAPFSVANKLRKVVAAELLKVELQIEKIDFKADFSKLDPKALNSVKNVAMQLLASDALEAAVFECLARCTLDGEAIKRDSFEEEAMRGDFLPCAWEVIRRNLAPFFANLDLSSLAPIESLPAAGQK